MTRAQTDRLEIIVKRSHRTLDDVTELWNERAAHREYDGGKSRKEAEMLALDDVAERAAWPERGRSAGSMSGSFRDGEVDPTPRSPQVPRWPACRCENVGRGECRCDDDGMVSHGGTRREGFNHGLHRDGSAVWA